MPQELHQEVVDLATWWRHIDGASWRHPEGPGSTVASRMQHPVVHISYVDAKVYPYSTSDCAVEPGRRFVPACIRRRSASGR
jgi:formylglycine-generating enzyme required for sulfatase activity